MLEHAKPVGFILTVDAPRARRFYEGVLGLRVVGEDDFALVLETVGCTLRIVKMKTWTPSPHTVFGWEVPDVARSVAALAERGVTCERYDFLEQDAAGVWAAPDGRARIAWFKDPDGNVLSFSQH